MKKKLALIIFTFLILLMGKVEALTLTQKLGNEYITTNVEQGEKVNMSFISKIGFQFRNWVISGVTGIDTTSPTINFQIGTQNVTIEAKYDEKYKISFNSMGGNENINTIEVPAGSSKTIPLTTLTKEGHTFLGWATEEDGDVEYIGGESVKPERNIDLYAKWRINQYTITFNTNGGTSISSITQDYGTNIEKPADPVRTDYKFLGWDKEIPAIMPAENITITALWEQNIAQAIYIAEDKSLNFIRGKLKTTNDTHNDKPITAVYTGFETRAYDGNAMGWYTYRSEITTVNFETEIKPVSTGLWFYEFTNLTTINGIENLNTSNVTVMRYMFYNCKSLTSLDLSNFNTSNVTNMSMLFCGCTNLSELNISNFNTSNVTQMEHMFNSCNNLTSLNVSSFDTKNVTAMWNMFISCKSLTSLDLSNFNTSKVTSMENMFYNCNNLTSLNVSSFNTENVTNMNHMFGNCFNLTSLNVSNFNTSKVTNMASMFVTDKKLVKLDLSNFDTRNVTDMQYMFCENHALNELNISSFNTEKVTNMAYMFYGCIKLQQLNVSNFNTSKVTDMQRMFRSCYVLKKLDVSSFDTTNVTNMYKMFGGCRNVTELNLTGFNTNKVTDMMGMFEDMPKLQEVTLGETFSFKSSAVLPTPSGGSWYNSLGEAIAPADIPSGKADTYYASSSLVP